MARTTQKSDIFVAKRSFHVEIDGERIFVTAGERVRKGHELLTRYSDAFEPIDTTVHYDVEQATAAPGERRGDRATAR